MGTRGPRRWELGGLGGACPAAAAARDGPVNTVIISYEPLLPTLPMCPVTPATKGAKLRRPQLQRPSLLSGPLWGLGVSCFSWLHVSLACPRRPSGCSRRCVRGTVDPFRRVSSCAQARLETAVACGGQNDSSVPCCVVPDCTVVATTRWRRCTDSRWRRSGSGPSAAASTDPWASSGGCICALCCCFGGRYRTVMSRVSVDDGDGDGWTDD